MRHQPRPGADEPHEYGVVPRSRRRLLVVACAVVAILAVAGGLLLDWFTDSSVRWGWLIVSAGFIAGIYAFYLWIRLSD